jgi:hypothetical protein
VGGPSAPAVLAVLGGLGLIEGLDDLVIVTQRQQEYSKQYVVASLNRLGCKELADEASQDLPDPLDVRRLEAWCVQHRLPTIP